MAKAFESFWRNLPLPFMAALVVLCLVLPAAARAQSAAIETLLGTWTGTGILVFKAGNSEKIRCNSYNTGSHSELRLVIRCASASYKVEIRSKLTHEAGRLTGTWEERTYNAEGKASGSIGAGALTLAITGGGFSGSMKVGFMARSQNVSINTEGIDMKSLKIKLTKSGK